MSTLHEWRRAAKLTQAQLAEKTGISRRTIEKYESGEKDIRRAAAETVAKIARALGCTVEDMIE